ncbi:MAG: cupin domain-containing protein [Cellvibrionaceae bacterium]
MTKQQLIEQLQLERHIEGGYFKRSYQSDHQPPMDTPVGKRLRISSIYYLLTDDAPIGRWHLNQSDILHYFHRGDPIRYYLIDEQGELTTHLLGPDPSLGHCLQLAVKGGTWKASQLEQGNYGLLSEAVCPGFEYQDMQLGEASRLLAQFPQHRQQILALLPNSSGAPSL